MRVKRSVTLSFSVDPMNRVLSVKFVVSTTSVSPSQWPMESPSHLLIVPGRCVPPIRTTRASCTISVRIRILSGVCTIW